MASAKKKSSKRSATSSVWPPPDAPTLFIDRSAWSNRLADALRLQHIRFIALHDRFPIDVSDQEWLRVASDEGWIVLSRDKRIRRKPNELAALHASKVVMFALVAGNATAADTAQIVGEALPRMYALTKGAKRPALFSIYRDGRIGRIKLRIPPRK
jgi:predicted nuclease of predicted toxin-antitoxin system